MGISVYIAEEELQARIVELAEELNERFKDEPLHLVGILTGSVFFLCELAKHLTMPVTIDLMKVSSYGNGTESTGKVKILFDLSESIEGQNVCIVEDIIDTGRTLKELIAMLKERKPKTLFTCVMLDKPARRKVDMEADYVGFSIEDAFVVGFGLDYAQKYRNLPYIGLVEE